MELMTITQAAKVKNVTRQAIYLAIKEGRLKAYYDQGKLQKVSIEGLLAYESQKCSRMFMEYNGKKIYDGTKGFMSIVRAAELTGIAKSRLYYSIYNGHLKAERRGTAWVVLLDDVIEYSKIDFRKKKSEKMFEL